MVLLLEVLAVLAVVFGVAVLLTGRSEGLSDEARDFADTGIPRDRAMTAQDVTGLRFALAFRGYRMSEVDDALDRLAAELNARDEELAMLRESAPPAPTGFEASAPEYVPAEQPGFAPPDFAPSEAGWEPRAEQAPYVPYVPSDATGDVAPGTEVDVVAAPDAGEPQADEPEFREPDPLTDPLPPEPAAPSPYRPEVPEIPTYDPWAVTPRSRYTDGPTFVEVEHADDDADEQVGAITEHHTGYAPTTGPTDDDEPEGP